ncbi:MAG: type II toxin-antitoxin system Phd/YefM family antitoxin [Oscillochloris sp.]|nr:type II toxin-antitoxin system Phd/YefM family antitoxin [Oscillochloris sp.]
MSMATRMNLNVDLQRGVVPISKAASSLAALIKRTGTTGQPVIVTQKGYPTGVLLSIELFSALKGLADDQGEGLSLPEPTASDAIVDAQVEEPAMPAVTEEVAPDVITVEPQRPAPRRRKAAKAEVVA